MKIIFYLIKIVLLTLFTQIGGILYFFSIIGIKSNATKYRFKRLTLFIVTYILATFFVIPKVAPLFGREKIKETSILVAHSFFYKLLNRNYVKPKLNIVLTQISQELNKQNKGLKLIYLDANFPFYNGFPLLPHLSHNDGKKIDISFIYTENNKTTNKKPSKSGYGIYEKPKNREYNQINSCRKKGYWQYDFPKYLTLGTANNNLIFSEKMTRQLLLIITKQQNISKIFIEPHLRQRLKLSNKKIRYHGCQSVRHDDHIHLQIK